MEVLDTTNGSFKTLLFRVANLLNGNPLTTACRWISFAILYTADQTLLLIRVLVALSFRVLFGIWPKSLNVVPFQVCAKDRYYEDPGVTEMRAMLQGRDCFDTHLEQHQKLPFPPPDYDPYDKVYLASYFHTLVRTISNTHMFFVQYGGALYDRINNFFVFQKVVNYVSTRVAVNID